jgi:hypothetical protein
MRWGNDSIAGCLSQRNVIARRDVSTQRPRLANLLFYDY